MGTRNFFLFDPNLRNELDEIFIHDLYPPILAQFEDQPFSIPGLEEIGLTDTRSGIEAARNALFLMTDPHRPIGTPRRPCWYIRFNLESRIIGYMLHTELLLSLPFSIEPDWVLDLLVNARSWNTSPSLSTDSDEFLLSFSSGVGQNYLLQGEELIYQLTEPFRKHIKIAKAVDRFSKQPRNRLLKSNMLQCIAEMYRGY